MIYNVFVPLKYETKETAFSNPLKIKANHLDPFEE